MLSRDRASIILYEIGYLLCADKTNANRAPKATPAHKKAMLYFLSWLSEIIYNVSLSYGGLVTSYGGVDPG